MNYGKLKFEGEYKTMYNTIKTSGNSSVKEIYDYVSVAHEIEGLEGWAGESKDSNCATLKSIDGECLSLSNYVSLIVAKTKVVYEVLFPNLEMYKNTIDLYNACIDQRDSISSRLATAKAKKNNKKS